MSEIKKQAEQIASETHYEDLACEILKGVEFKDEKAIAQAIVQLSDYLHKNIPSPQEVTDSEIEKEATRMRNCYNAITAFGGSEVSRYESFINGAKWMRDKVFKTKEG